MKSTSRKVAKKKQLTIAVNAAICLLTAQLMVTSHTTQAQEPVVISVSGDNSFIFLSESEYPDGGELIIEESGSVEVIDHTSFDGTSVWNVTIDGIVRGYIYGIDEYESITLENGGSVTVSATGQSSPIELRDGGTVVNNGLIEGLITGDDSNGTSLSSVTQGATAMEQASLLMRIMALSGYFAILRLSREASMRLRLLTA